MHGGQAGGMHVTSLATASFAEANTCLPLSLTEFPELPLLFLCIALPLQAVWRIPCQLRGLA